MEKIPTDNHIRTLLDTVSPEALQPCFDQVIATTTAGRLEGISEAGGTDAGGSRWDRVFLFAKAELSAVSYSETKQQQGGALSFHAGGDVGAPRGQVFDRGVNYRRAWP